MKYDPDLDGIDHINVYSKGRTELGALLSNFANTPFKHPVYGHFSSVEGFWYYIKTGFQHDTLRRLYGASAKTAGGRFVPIAINEEQFKTLICEAIREKIIQTPQLKQLLIKSTLLPFAHYYVYGSKVIPVTKHDWQIEYISKLRIELQGTEQTLVLNDPPL
jgi:hypothetical protein